jgi:hypothetical protein
LRTSDQRLEIDMQSPTSKNATHPVSGLTVSWLLADDPRTVRTQQGEERTVIELRDPRRLANAIVIWLDGPAGALAQVPAGTPIHIHLDALRAGKNRGSLIATVSREAVEAAAGAALGARS